MSYDYMESTCGNRRVLFIVDSDTGRTVDVIALSDAINAQEAFNRYMRPQSPRNGLCGWLAALTIGAVIWAAIAFLIWSN